MLKPRLSGRTVALVGNAKSLSAQALGPAIDACDIVIRLNAAPQASPESHGRLTHWLAASSFLPSSRLTALNPGLLLWMSPRRRMLARLAYGWRWPMSFYPLSWWRDLSAALGGCRPSTGLMTIDLLRRLGGYRELNLFGFDFFQSGSLSTRALAAPPPHDFAREREHVLELLRGQHGLRLIGGGAVA
jgi:hypothetical protein